MNLGPFILQLGTLTTELYLAQRNVHEKVNTQSALNSLLSLSKTCINTQFTTTDTLHTVTQDSIQNRNTAGLLKL